MTTTVEKTTRRTPIYVHIAAWSIPVLVLTQFSMLAIVPVAIVMIATLADKRVSALRWWAGALTLVYAAPLVIWLVREDGAQSLSKDMHTVFVVLIVTAAIAFLVKIYTRHKR